jgi:riboflavin synthase
MFTGLIQAVSPVAQITSDQIGVLVPPSFLDEPLELGESIAINGVCLTVVASEGEMLFDVSEETQRRTALGELAPGDFVNLERAMKATDRFGGHIVQGHVDRVGRILQIEPREDFSRMRFDVGPENARLLIDKGSVTLDGISLTVVHPGDDASFDRGIFDAWIIPHTFRNTNLSIKKEGDGVNVEFDVVA